MQSLIRTTPKAFGPLFLTLLLLAASSLRAQTAHPITSLPKPPQPQTTDTPTPAPATVTTPAPELTPAPAPVVTDQPSSSQPPAAPPQSDATPLQASLLPTTPTPPGKPTPRPIRPFSTAAIQLKVGLAGIGVDVAVPVATHLNLRVGGSFFSYSGSFDTDSIHIDGDAKLRSATASLDYFPFHHSSFHLSPGITLYNGNNLNAITSVAAGNKFSLGDTDYYSSPTDPVHGTASFTFGNHVAPSFTVGFGNMIPRSGGRFSFPFELGFQYIGTAPQIHLYLAGSACEQNPNAKPFDPTSCAPVQSDASTQANLHLEESQINDNITALRFYPIISQGFAVRF